MIQLPKFIFVHIVKTGGTSFRENFLNIIYRNRYVCDSLYKPRWHNRLQSIRDNDRDGYHATTSEDLTLYEWWVTLQRIDGLPFHTFNHKLKIGD